MELSRVPRELSILYEDIYSKIIEREKDTARAVLQNTLKWMMCSRRLLSQEDFLRLTTVFLDVHVDEFDSEVILELLSNFITSYKTMDGVQCFRFAHLSVREFLEKKPEYCIGSINCFAAKVCILKVICCSGSPSVIRFVHDMGLDVGNLTPSLEADLSHWRGFYNYSVEYWGEHCGLAGEYNRSKDSQLHKLLQYLMFDNSGESCPMNSWWRSYQQIVGNLSVGNEMEIVFHNHGEMYERAIFLASWFGFEEIARMELRKTTDSSLILNCARVALSTQKYSILKILFGNTTYTQPLKHIICEMVMKDDIHGLRECLSLLDPANVGDNILFFARSAEIVSMLLDHNKDLKITPELVDLSFSGKSTKAIGVYLKLAPELTITSGILENVCRLDFDSFKYIVDRVNPNIITCDVIASAASNDCNSARKTKLLLSLAGEIDVTEAAMIRAIRFSKNSEAMRNLLSHGWPVTQLVLEAIALEGNIEGFQLIFEQGTFKVTPRLLKLGATNILSGSSILEFLMSIQDDRREGLTWNGMLMMQSKINHGGRKVMKILSSLRPGVHIPEEVISTVFDHWGHYDIQDLVFDRNLEFRITNHVVHAVLQRLDSDPAIMVILRRLGDKVIPSSMMRFAAQNPRFGDRMVEILLDKYAKIEPPSAELVNAAICNDNLGYEILQILEARFGKCPFSDINLEHAAALGSLKTLKLILARISTREIKPAVLLAAARSGHLSVLKHILNLRTCPITVEMVIAAAGNQGAGAEKLKLIWDRAPDIKPQVEMFLQDARAFRPQVEFEGLYSCRADIFNLLLDRLEDPELCQQVLEAAAKSQMISSFLLVETMLERKIPLLFSTKILHDALEAGQNGLAELIMRHTTDVLITQDTLDLAARCGDSGSLRALRQYGDSQKLDFTQVDERLTRLTREYWVERVEFCLES